VGAALVLATLLNGIVTYGRRVGIVDRAEYERFWTERCGPRGTRPVWLGLGRRCVALTSGRGQDLPALAAYTLTVNGAGWSLKAVKDAVIVLMIGAGLCWTRRVRAWSWKAAWLPGALAILVGVGAVAGLAGGRLSQVLAGLRSFAFLPIALLWMPAASPARLARVAAGVAWLLVLECALLPGELLYGLMDRPTGSFRASATLVHPNTLGIVAVIALAFGLSFADRRGWIPLLWVTAIALVACARSGTGWIVLALLGTVRLSRARHLKTQVRYALVAACVLLALSAVATLTGRFDVLSSLIGRWEALQAVFAPETGSVLLGDGLGTGSNASSVFDREGRLPSDSMITLLLRQGGLPSVALFYAILLTAWRRDLRSRDFFAAVLVCSLGANLAETFPVNVLLGLGLASSLRRPVVAS
jgi:hypothetical protein